VSFDDLELLHRLGSGCSSVVYLARHKRTGVLWAVKILNLYDKSVKEMLLRELRALYRADCEAIVGFAGATYREGNVAVLLEYADLGGLDNVLNRAPGKKIPEHTLSAVAFQVLWGLAYLFYERRLHRDIKPQNILVFSSGNVKLTDLGISRELSTAVLARTYIGSFRYMSPERIQHEPYGFASDVWSLGLVILECALGRYPFTDCFSHIALIMSVTEGDLPLPKRDGSFTSEFYDFIDHCVCRDPNQRASILELLQSPWFVRHGISSLPHAIDVTREWLDGIGLVSHADVSGKSALDGTRHAHSHSQDPAVQAGAADQAQALAASSSGPDAGRATEQAVAPAHLPPPVVSGYTLG
jgi:mitogen-activated protein kinase kinase 1